MEKAVVIVGSLDTKGEEVAFIRDLVAMEGLKTLVVDCGTMGEPAFKPNVTRGEVAAAAGGDPARLASGEHRDEAVKTMAAGLAVVVRGLYEKGRLHGIIGMGGAVGTSVATTAMRTLPVGLPKVMVSTVGGGDVSTYAGTKDITFIPSIVDVAGINRISRRIFANAAGAIAGMVKMEIPRAFDEKPLVAASMSGNTTACVEHARSVMEKMGYEVLVFHTAGAGGRTMESLVDDGFVVGSMDITTTELADFVCGGLFNAGPDRCMAASRAGIPTVLVPGCVDMANFSGMETVPEKYKRRNLYRQNPNVTLLRTNVEENARMGEIIAAAANAAMAPVAVLLPLKGVSALDGEGGCFRDPKADRACFESIKKNLKPSIPVIEMDNNINDPEFAEKVALTLLNMLDL